ncbi:MULTISPECIES: FAD-binding oxidoreductase [unclassified Mesorhizobium]|uniref:NAD(P)/FAD-dependent oxidoreductase n=1 Tax=unclassified Mesorhizobium TaxID=325217 RepID=UPI000FDB5893|nr:MULTISPECIES: FAD-binding oxidoreductase [unclassified Mesorhizobium]TGQ31067.1 FAD-binding oxidoreductase [Mesorhizobium sp. M00.F.Ca.ET.216.01.1.1]TIS55726.1 MAG: FAD-dependent oxidoreductase [Mesorhizobium sp.]TIS86756.1 MAG: FAD-dependent oxidoreductase [Mesorhizobium sp.]TJW06393.1 MAG: FAD-dependent oxidoreductase [Mesorhizobium sp.]TJW45906.1 MAG: FAD-dependent oxidoreductase [Mesorhizobium sp.]
MKFESYWHDTAPVFAGAAKGPVESRYDVAVIGGGFTGLAAARHLATAGAKVVVMEAGRVGCGASGRNGGHLNNGLAHSFLAAKSELGTERAVALYRAFDDSVDTIERIVAEEGIDCDFRRAGKLKLASKPAHFEAIARNFAAVNREVDSDTELLTAADLKSEIGSSVFHGAMLSKKSAMMHMGRFVSGIADAAVRHGATIFEDTPVTARRSAAGRHELTTPRGTVAADNVLLATGAYTTSAFGYFRRRIVPVGSFIIATRPLSSVEIAATAPGNRTFVTSMNVGNYFRLSPDNRLIFGGRARFSATSDQRSDGKSGAILRASLAQIFPHLAGVEIDYCWGGLVDMTKDRFPRAGFADGLWFAMGYSGHGAQMSTHMGMIIADAILGKPDRNPVAGLGWPAVPGHFGKPWFLPMVGLYYKTLDRFQ